MTVCERAENAFVLHRFICVAAVEWTFMYVYVVTFIQQKL
jgi:hypothetical protein